MTIETDEGLTKNWDRNSKLEVFNTRRSGKQSVRQNHGQRYKNTRLRAEIGKKNRWCQNKRRKHSKKLPETLITRGEKTI